VCLLFDIPLFPFPFAENHTQLCAETGEQVSGKKQYRKYGCSQHWYRGACSNSLLERQIWLEKRLLVDLQSEILKPEALEYTIA
jgi:hypothetical protein